MSLFARVLTSYFLAWAALIALFLGLLLADARMQFLPRPAVSDVMPTMLSVQMVAGNVRAGGEKAFLRMADNWPRLEPPFVLPIDGEELLGRAVSDGLRTLVMEMAAEGPDPLPVRRTVGPEGRTYLVFHPQGTGPADRTPVYWVLAAPWILLILFAAVGLILAAALTAHWTRRLAALRAAFEDFGDERALPRLDPLVTEPQDEIGDLGRRFEEMAGRLTRSIGSQRQLLHDVSHEIRSPLARLSLAADLAQQRPERVPAALERIEKECGRLDRLVEEVLTLARLENGFDAPHEDYFDLLDLLRVVRDDVAFEAESTGIEVSLLVPDRSELVLRGRAELLHRAVENVVRNALQHAAGRIEIRLEDSEPERLVLYVLDGGEGIAEEDPQTLFEPFRREEDSTGFGLGLAIAQRAVVVHGGQIRARNHETGGAEFEIELPASLITAAAVPEDVFS